MRKMIRRELKVFDALCVEGCMYVITQTILLLRCLRELGYRTRSSMYVESLENVIIT